MMHEEHLKSVAWAVDQIMEASDDHISESGNGDDQMVAEGAPLSAQGGGCSQQCEHTDNSPPSNESEKQNNPYEEEKLIKDALPSETYAHYGRFGSIKRGRKL